MTTINFELYDALRSANVDDAKAKAAAESTVLQAKDVMEESKALRLQVTAVEAISKVTIALVTAVFMAILV
ncbi:MAG: hypothetical protein JO128_05845, partial [Alphaproteobacteria bacterium]|nr:hypothetical protein [Alphaproteobacteria bacterium]